MLNLKFSIYNHLRSHLALEHKAHRQLDPEQIEKACELNSLSEFYTIKYLLGIIFFSNSKKTRKPPKMIFKSEKYFFFYLYNNIIIQKTQKHLSLYYHPPLLFLYTLYSFSLLLL